MTNAELIITLRSFLAMMSSMAPVATARLLRGLAWLALGLVAGIAVIVMAVLDADPPLPGLLLLAPASAAIAGRLAAAGWLPKPVLAAFAAASIAGIIAAGAVAVAGGQLTIAAGCAVTSACLAIGGLLVTRARRGMGDEMRAAFAPQAAALGAIRLDAGDE